MVWKIWTKIYCSARNLLVHHSSLSHTTYVETKKAFHKIATINLLIQFLYHRGPRQEELVVTLLHVYEIALIIHVQLCITCVHQGVCTGKESLRTSNQMRHIWVKCV